MQTLEQTMKMSLSITSWVYKDCRPCWVRCTVFFCSGNFHMLSITGASLVQTEQAECRSSSQCLPAVWHGKCTSVQLTSFTVCDLFAVSFDFQPVQVEIFSTSNCCWLSSNVGALNIRNKAECGLKSSFVFILPVTRSVQITSKAEMESSSRTKDMDVNSWRKSERGCSKPAIDSIT